MPNISCLPPEILVQIFRFYLQTETQYKFFHCVATVCRDWQKLCFDPSCWQSFDGSLSFDVLKELCNNGILKYCKMLVLSKMDKCPSAKEMAEVYSHLPQLKCINFSYVMGMRDKIFFVELDSKCPALQEIVYNDKVSKLETKLGIEKYPIFGISLFKDFLEIRGTNLVSLVFSDLYMTLFAIHGFFSTIGLSCPNLEVLRVENIDCEDTLSFPTVHMQIHCPKLRVLCLGDQVVISNDEQVVGFKNLEVFKHESKFNHLFPKCAIDSVIFASQKLKELDISRCVFIKSDCLHPFNYSHLENLNVSFGIVYNIICFTEVIHKWAHSLKVLNLSHMKDVALNNMFVTVVRCGSLPNLTNLYLNYTSVSIMTVSLIVQKCPKLRVLHLEGCPDLGEFSSNYEGVMAIKELYTRIPKCTLGKYKPM